MIFHLHWSPSLILSLPDCLHLQLADSWNFIVGILAGGTPVLLVLIEAHSFAFLLLLDILKSSLSNRLSPGVVLLSMRDRVSAVILSLGFGDHCQLAVPLEAGWWPLEHQHLS
jgi:hypothetical protein